MRFPKTIRHRRAEATIYGKRPKYPFYRVTYCVAGKRRFASFKTYAEAKAEAERVVREISSGSDASALTAVQSRDAIAAIQRLAMFRQATDRRLSLLAAVSEFAEASERLQGCSLRDAVEGYLRNVAVVRRKDVAEAVEDFIASRRHKSEAKDGKRAQLSAVYAYNVGNWLREFAKTFPATAVCDLTKDHLNAYIGAHKDVSSKSRNDRRATVKMFLGWCARLDYLPPTHRLLEADGMAREIVEAAETDFYRPKELQGLLENAVAIRTVLALGGLAGLRVEEIRRLEWADVWRVPGHIEITARNAKTRQRRLVEVCPSLAAWIEPHRRASGKVWGKCCDALHEEFERLRESLKIPTRRNGLRHAFCTYHFALHTNENLTAALAGNSPAMIHKHYKGLATKAEAEQWFQVTPGIAVNL